MSTAVGRHRELASVIVRSHHGTRATRLCLDALARHTRSPWELILIDDGRAGGTPACPASLRRIPDRIEVITDHGEFSFPAAWNRAIETSRGQHVVFLNHDVTVTNGWLDPLIALAESSPLIGLVGPMSNHAPPPQRLDVAACANLAAMYEFADQWRSEHRGQWLEAERLAAFCLLVKRRVFEAIGGLDEQLGLGLAFETLAMRAREAGFCLAIAYDLYVHRLRDWTSAWRRVARFWDQIPGMFDFQAVYDAAVEAAKPGAVFVEIGCLAGRSTCYLADRIRSSGKAISLYAIDPATGSPSDATGQTITPAVGGSFAGILHRNILGCGLEEFVVPILTTSVRAARLFPDEGVDFCFIDGDHSYASVTADLGTWWPKIRPGGMLAGHDYRQTAPWLLGLTPAVHEFFGVEDATHPVASTCWVKVKGAATGPEGAG